MKASRYIKHVVAGLITCVNPVAGIMLEAINLKLDHDHIEHEEKMKELQKFFLSNSVYMEGFKIAQEKYKNK